MNAPSIGIDFGTTTSSMAWVDPRTGKAEVLKNAEGEEKTPSVVYFGDGAPLVGTAAEQMLEDEDERRRVVASIKRELVNAPTLALPGRRVMAVEVAAAVLAKLKHDAEALYFRAPVTRAVITCPAGFYAMERDEIAQAARLAGFAEVELLHEPVPPDDDRSERLARYKDAVTEAWSDQRLDPEALARFDRRVAALGLDVDQAAAIEREVIGETREAVPARQHENSLRAGAPMQRPRAADSVHRACGRMTWTTRQLRERNRP